MILYPVEIHTDGFIPTLFHGYINNVIGTYVVNLEGRGWLGMDHLGEYGTDNGLLFGIKKVSNKFSFSARR